MKYEWGAIDYDNDFDEFWNFYGVAKWLVKQYLKQVIKPEKKYTRKDAVKMVQDLDDLIDEDLLEKINISSMTYSALEEVSFDWILSILGKGLSTGDLRIDDLKDGYERVVIYFIREELQDAFESQMWILFCVKKTALGKEILSYLD